MRIELDFNKMSDAFNHKCESKMVGDWIEWTCPQCPKYRRLYNRKTRRMVVMGNNVQHVNHFGDNSMQ